MNLHRRTTMEKYTTDELILELTNRQETKTDEQQLVDDILNTTTYIDRDSYVSDNLTTDMAFEALQGYKHFITDAIWHGLLKVEDIPIDELYPKDLAYRLAIEYPDMAIELYDELSYYKQKGRI